MPDPSSNQPTTEAATSQTNPEHKPRRRTWRTFFVSLGVAMLALLVVAGAGLTGAEYWTSRPVFCGSCHIMDPYYESYTHDIHGRKIGALCVDCHYAPGERFTIKAKFKGLSQVTSYFSGRYGAGRPRAHVDDDSCMTSACHGDNDFRGKRLAIGEPRTEIRYAGEEKIEVQRVPTVHFFHAKHLDAEQKVAEAQQKLASARARLAALLSPEAFTRIEKAARSIEMTAARDAGLTRLCDELSLDDPGSALVHEFAGLVHRDLRLAQLSGLNCSSCHNFDPSLANHIAVDRNACYTCHFTGESFNQGTAECLLCHEAPSRAVLIHERASGSTVQPTLMDHNDIIQRGVDCASCHWDVVRGDTRVTIRECTHCHDQDKFLADFATRDSETVRAYHAVHVEGQRARCVDCHRTMEHGLLDPERLAGSGDLLEPVRSNCQHCHPGHHSEQVSLLTGTGGRGLPHDTPSAMLGSRLNCRACHTESGTDLKGDDLIKATQQGCVACHGDDYSKLFDQWSSEIGTYVRESQARLDRVRNAAAAAAEAGKALAEVDQRKLDDAAANVRLVAVGAGMHNRHYALQLLDAANRTLEQLEAALGK